MLQLILMLSLSPVMQPQTQTAKFKPCVWPNTCSKTSIELVEFKPCVWPNTCSGSATI